MSWISDGSSQSTVGRQVRGFGCNPSTNTVTLPRAEGGGEQTGIGVYNLITSRSGSLSISHVRHGLSFKMILPNSFKIYIQTLPSGKQTTYTEFRIEWHNCHFLSGLLEVGEEMFDYVCILLLLSSPSWSVFVWTLIILSLSHCASVLPISHGSWSLVAMVSPEKAECISYNPHNCNIFPPQPPQIETWIIQYIGAQGFCNIMSSS